MSTFPLYVTLVMTMLLSFVQAAYRFPIEIKNQYAALVTEMTVCHEALIQYADAHQSTFGTIPASSVDAYLPPGATDPGSFTYILTSPGTATTYLTTVARGQSFAVAAIQGIANYSVTAGPVTAGMIVPLLPAQPVAVVGGVPSGVIAVQTVLRNH
ncbi:MAG TPA: hypothetical protein VGU69_10465 [Rhizomicrobium sp.]|nr:hypothetical protein [Rhizomicrobium sp.]